MSPAEWVFMGVVLVLVAVAFVGPALTRLSRPRSPSHDQGNRCPCGEPATDASPRLARGRGSVLRDLLGMPPRYRRVVGWRWSASWAATYCRGHAHLADAEVGLFLSSERRELMTLYARIASRAAAFETEGLHAKVLEGMSERQREAASKPRVLGKWIRENDGLDVWAPVNGAPEAIDLERTGDGES